ncbi:MAG TPA: hypothetical protein VK934_04530 [Fimbriimonas sp.]|nr:hypothetical protein [Fimbriimonas sp.]
MSGSLFSGKFKKIGMDQPSTALRELIDSFNENQVEYLVIGAHALAFHGLPRYTGDFDIWVKQSPENAKRIRTALQWVGFDLGAEGQERLTHSHEMLILGSGPGHVEILTFDLGIDFDAAWSRKLIGLVAGLKLNFLSLEDFVAAKRFAGRRKDLADLDALRELRGTLPGD